MKRTLNINIGNSIIHIEEDACELLTNYLIEVKQHFGKSADDFEIVADIENRIAEMFLEALSTQQKQVIELADVQVVIASMGSVKDFEDNEEEIPDAAESETNSHSARFAERKIYRDTDEAMLAGVCSGLSHYLKIDVSILRIVAVLSVFLGGSGLFAYLILWVAIPKALTRAEKMAMKGEAATLEGFKRNFEEELSSVKHNLKNANEHLEPLVKRSGNFIVEFLEVLGRLIPVIGKAILKFIAVVIIILGPILLFATFIVLAALFGFWDSSASQIFPFTIINESYFTDFIIAVFVVLAVPIIALVLLSIRVAFSKITIHKMISYGLLLVWLAGVSVTIFYIAKITNEFKEEAIFTQEVPIKPFPVYTLELNRSMFFSKDDSLRYQLNSAEYSGMVIQNDGDGPFTLPRNVIISVEKAEGNVPVIVQSYRSQGRNFEVALKQAKNIQYSFVQTDSVLKFSPEIRLKNRANWRDQRVEIVIKLPVGMKINVDRKLDGFFQGYSLWSCDEYADDPDADHSHELYKGIMTADGLECQNKH